MTCDLYFSPAVVSSIVHGNTMRHSTKIIYSRENELTSGNISNGTGNYNLTVKRQGDPNPTEPIGHLSYGVTLLPRPECCCWPSLWG